MKVVALAGGVGGAKLAAVCKTCCRPGDLSVVVNTADDFDLWGLHICPDLDTVMYTLAGIANPETGWGIAGESFETLNMLEQLRRGHLVQARRQGPRDPHAQNVTACSPERR